MILGQLELTGNKDHIFRHWKARKRASRTVETNKTNFFVIFTNWKIQCANDTSSAKDMLLGLVFWVWQAFCCSQQNIIIRFEKERLNNIWQEQVPLRSVQPGVPQWEGNLARLCSLLQAWLTPSLLRDEYHGVVFEYTDFMQKRPWGRLHASLQGIYNYWGPRETFNVMSSFFSTGMHKWIL